MLLSDRVQALDRSNYDCFLALSKTNTAIKLKHSQKMNLL